MQAAGEDIGDMFEISTVRREDWDFIQVMIGMIRSKEVMIRMMMIGVGQVDSTEGFDQRYKEVFGICELCYSLFI